MRNKTEKMGAFIRSRGALPLLLAVLGLNANAQGTGDMSIPDGLPTVIPPSPTVAALMKFEEVPVNNYNGVPDINIPIYNAKANGGINLEIKLGYHPSNINANQAASDCGLGWSLFAGGTISRTVKGMPDEILVPGSRLGIYRTPEDASNANWYYTISNSGNQNISQEYRWDVMVAGKSDTEHDLYQYNFLGYSGRFIVMKVANGSLQVVKLDRNPLKIANFYNPGTFVPKAQAFVHNSFEITDDKGFRYRFDVVETTSTANSTFRTKPYGGNGTDASSAPGFTYRSAFHLSKIYDPSNALVAELSYTNDGRKEMTVSSSRTFASKTGTDMSTVAQQYASNGAIMEFNPLSLELTSSYQQTTLIRKLSRIKVVGQSRIHFTYTTGRLDSNIPGASNTYKLSQVTVRTWKDSLQQRRFDLAYGYSTKKDKRMVLSSVKAYDSGGAFEYDYGLSYRDTSPVPGLIGKDHWGYLNQRPSYMATGRYQETTPGHCTNDVLEIMKIPTGGAIRFNYEANTYSYIGGEAVTNFDENPDNWIDEQTPPKVFTTVVNNTTPFFELGGLAPVAVHFQAASNFIGTLTDWRFKIYRLQNGSLVEAGSLWSQTERSITLAPGIYSVGFDTPGQSTHSVPISASIVAHYKRKPLGTIQNPVQEKKYLYGGGIRIRNIQHYRDFNLNTLNDPLSVPERQTNYSYGFFAEGLRSSGSLVYPKPIFRYGKQKRECMRVYSDSLRTIPNQHIDIVLDYDIATTTDNLSAIKTKGSEVGYKNVTVTETGNGRRESAYTSGIDFPEQLTTFNTQYPFLPTENIDYKRGNLLSSRTYDQQGRLLDETVNTYDYDDAETLQTGLRFYYPSDYQFINYYNFITYAGYNSFLNSCTNCFCTSGQPNTFINFKPIRETFGNANLKTSVSRQYFYEGASATALAPVQSTTAYTYDPYNKKIRKQEVTNSLGETLATEYYYARNLPTEPNAAAMEGRNMISAPLRIVNSRNGEKMGEQKVTYRDWGSNLLAPETIQSAKGTAALETRVRYTRMDNGSGQPLEVQQEGGTRVCYVWGYNKTVPVAKIENISYDSIPVEKINAVQNASNSSVTGLEADLIQALRDLRDAVDSPGTLVTTLTYMPLVGIRTVTDPKGGSMTYDYDYSGRLTSVKDHEGKFVSQHSYNYRP